MFSDYVMLESSLELMTFDFVMLELSLTLMILVAMSIVDVEIKTTSNVMDERLMMGDDDEK